MLPQLLRTTTCVGRRAVIDGLLETLDTWTMLFVWLGIAIVLAALVWRWQKNRSH
jgi:membrane protein implicated in regulation of membrane protease activity